MIRLGSPFNYKLQGDFFGLFVTVSIGSIVKQWSWFEFPSSGSSFLALNPPSTWD